MHQPAHHIMRQPEHARFDVRQQRFAYCPLGFTIGTQIGGDDSVAGALDENRALGLRIAGMAGAAAGAAKGLDVVLLVGHCQVAAVYRH